MSTYLRTKDDDYYMQYNWGYVSSALMHFILAEKALSEVKKSDFRYDIRLNAYNQSLEILKGITLEFDDERIQKRLSEAGIK